MILFDSVCLTEFSFPYDRLTIHYVRLHVCPVYSHCECAQMKPICYMKAKSMQIGCRGGSVGKALAAKPNDLSSISRTQLVEREC